ncbi:hypothetical protein [Paenibacillus alginolyticus]|uniref:Uncharacterized protein n=1 Tax=Paenibacillus alginolyticus TaxID=59839 RepID=A0ABT4GGX6_9BACL|nr:hypothetical protein [Paenibacillus alginolyticus]MCY9695319.1 hypothetical protein [Paenibacillus alginolyticus]MEC0144789.1 hypothetical protein [Paenibacillus alginolyticus]
MERVKPLEVQRGRTQSRIRLFGHASPKNPKAGQGSRTLYTAKLSLDESHEENEGEGKGSHGAA